MFPPKRPDVGSARKELQRWVWLGSGTERHVCTEVSPLPSPLTGPRPMAAHAAAGTSRSLPRRCWRSARRPSSSTSCRSSKQELTARPPPVSACGLGAGEGGTLWLPPPPPKPSSRAASPPPPPLASVRHLRLLQLPRGAHPRGAAAVPAGGAAAAGVPRLRLGGAGRRRRALGGGGAARRREWHRRRHRR